MPGKTRIAIMGAGLIGRVHAKHVAREAELVALVDPAPEAVALAETHAVPLYASLEDLFSADRPDGVIIATPNRLHAGNARACIDEGIGVLIEKPISDSVADAQALVDHAEAAKVPILVGHHRRHNPIIQRARAFVESGALGKLVTVNAMCWLYKPDEYFQVAWRTQPGAGPILINLIHDIDLLRYLCGEVVEVQAQAEVKGRGHAVEDTAVATLKFENRALGTVSVSDAAVAPWSWELTAGENPLYPFTGASCYTLGGTGASLSLPDLTVWRYADRKAWSEPISHDVLEVVPEDPLAIQIRHFAQVLRGEAEPLVSGREGLASLKVLLAIAKAAAAGSTVRLQD